MYSLNRTWTWLFWSATPISGWTGGGHADDGILGCRWNSYVWLLFLIENLYIFVSVFFWWNVSIVCLFLSWNSYMVYLFVVMFLLCCTFFFVVIVLPRGPRFTVVKIPLKIPLKSIEIHWNSWNFNNKSLLFRSNPWSFMVDLRKAWWAPWQPWEPWELRWKEPWHALDMAAMVLLWEMQS